MIQKGYWKGYYSFSNPQINKIRGHEKTGFEIEIVATEKNSFSGTVKDDLNTGGTEGIGEISGLVKGDKVAFIKRMPVMTLLVDRKGTRRTFKRKHRPIYYTGTISEDGKTISGSWKFRFGIIWLGLIPLPAIPSRGTWQMKFSEI